MILFKLAFGGKNMSVLKHIQPKIYGMTGGLFANWMPNNAVSIGDFGTLQRCAFERLGSLQDHGIEIATVSIEGGKNSLEYKDKASVDASASAIATDALSGGEGSVAVQFSGRGAFLYHLSDVDQNRPANMKSFYEQVGQALLSGVSEFPNNGVLVTEIQKAEKATIVVSDSMNGSLELKTKFEPAGEAFLSGAKGGVSAGASTGSLFQWIANDNTVTLLRLIRPVFPPPTGGRGGSPLLLSTVVNWIRDLIGGRDLHVGELSLSRYVEGAKPALVFEIAETGHEVELSFADITVSELLETDDETAHVKIEEVPYRRPSEAAN